METNLKQIANETEEFIIKLRKMHRNTGRCMKIIVPKEEFLSLHDEIKNNGNAIALVCYDIELATFVRFHYDRDYYELLKDDLDNLIDLIIRYIEPFTDIIKTTIANNNYRQLLSKSFKHKIFDNEILDNKNTFDYYLGNFFRENGLLDLLYYSLPEELMKEQFTTLLYRKLSAFELAVAYFANCLDSEGANEISLKVFEGNEKTDSIFVELGSRKTSEVFEFLKSIIKIPCEYPLGVTGAFIHLIDNYTHENLRDTIFNLRYEKGFDGLEKIDFDILYQCLEDAEKVKHRMGNISNFNPREKSLRSYIKDYYAK